MNFYQRLCEAKVSKYEWFQNPRASRLNYYESLVKRGIKIRRWYDEQMIAFDMMREVLRSYNHETSFEDVPFHVIVRYRVEVESLEKELALAYRDYQRIALMVGYIRAWEKR
jgi:hypothetical protein